MGPAMEVLCSNCRRPKAGFTCGLCEGAVCKKCLETLEEGRFALEAEPREPFRHRHYCGRCFLETVAPRLDEYDRLVRRAEKVTVFLKKHGGEETRLFPRIEKPYRVADCLDERETLLKLAFHAAALGYNALVDVETFRKKVRNHGYQSSRWEGVGIPSRFSPPD